MRIGGAKASQTTRNLSTILGPRTLHKSQRRDILGAHLNPVALLKLSALRRFFGARFTQSTALSRVSRDPLGSRSLPLPLQPLLERELSSDKGAFWGQQGPLPTGGFTKHMGEVSRDTMRLFKQTAGTFRGAENNIPQVVLGPSLNWGTPSLVHRL